MKPADYLAGCFLLLAVVVDIVQPTCVLESDFGFKINCAFKKSGLFRVRNLGGLKAHASIGFSLGDELGFEQSLTNQDPSRRRSVSVKSGAPPNLIADTSARPAAKQEKRGRIMMRPSVPGNRPNQQAMDRLTSLHRRASTTMQPIFVNHPTVDLPVTVPKTQQPQKATIAKPYPMGVPAFKPLPPKDDSLHVIPIAVSTRKTYTPLQVPQSKGPALAYTSENYQRLPYNQMSQMVTQMTQSHHHPYINFVRITPSPIIVDNYTPNVYNDHHAVNPFVPMPVAPTQALTIIPAPVFQNSVQIPLAPSMFKSPSGYSLAQNSLTMSIHKPDPPISNFVDPVPHHVHELATQLYPSYNTKKVDDYNSITGYGDDTTLRFNKDEINEKIAEIAKAGNISMEAVEAAIALRQQQLLNKYASVQVPTTTTTTTTSTTTQAPFVFEPEPEPVVAVPSKPKRAPTSGKVMNAPREYYPVGYEKNFDDQFQSKVDLPDTNFHCGDQKYFPGLYGDENLGCMVFHVCALTDDGLVMKSFLCPESTLFDQTILKCNWWFYVDCKSTRKLYDTNIPVSKSYQLMKALTFFSSYKKDMQNGEQQTNPDEMEGVKEAITILGNQDDSKRSQTIQIVTPQPTLNTDTNNFTPVYRANRNYKNSTRDVNNSRDKQKSDTDDIQTASSEIRLVKVSADMNFNKAAQSFGSVETVTKTTSSESSSRERQYKRKPTLRKSTVNTSRTTSISTTTTTSTPTTVNTTTVQPNVILSNPIFEVVKQEIQPIEQFNQQLPQHQTDVTQEKLTDQIDSADKIEPDSEKLPPVRRFYRSSAEALSKEMTMVNNEQIQIVRPTSYAKLVGEFQTPTATIAKLDEAILGRFKPITTKREASRRQRRSTNRNRT